MIHKTLFGSQQEEISAPFLHGTLPQICNNIPGLSLCVSSYSIAKKKKKKDRYILVRKQANRNMQVCIYGMLSEGRALNPENSLTISSWDRNS